ncbi:YdiY family protein [Vibrio neonatus]
MSKKLLFCLGSLLCSAPHAEELTDTDIESPSPFKSEVEFGYQAHSGNSDSESLNARLSGEYIKNRYRLTGEWKYYLLYKDGAEDKRQSTYDLQGDYKLGPKSYAYSNFNGYDSKYSAYFTDYTVSVGLGYQITNTKHLLIEGELGPGYRYQEPNLDEIDDDDIIMKETVQEAIIRGNLSLVWKPIKSLSVGTNVTVVAGESNTRTDTEISVINEITEDIALKLVHNRQYHNKVPDGLSHTDSVFSVNLLFLF